MSHYDWCKRENVGRSVTVAELNLAQCCTNLNSTSHLPLELQC